MLCSNSWSPFHTWGLRSVVMYTLPQSLCPGSVSYSPYYSRCMGPSASWHQPCTTLTHMQCNPQCSCGSHSGRNQPAWKVWLIHAKCLVNSLHFIEPAALPVDDVLLCTFLVLLLLSFLHHIKMPDTSSSLLVHGSPRIKDRPYPGLVQSWDVSHVDGGSIPVTHEFHLVLRPSWLQHGTVNRGATMLLCPSK